MTDLRPRPGPNDLLPCGTDTAHRRHLALGEWCGRCGTVGRFVPTPSLSDIVRRRKNIKLWEGTDDDEGTTD